MEALSPGRLSSPARRLLEGPLDSFEKLELVLALFRAAKPLTVADLARDFDLEVDQVRGVVRELVRAGLVSIESAEAGEMGGAGEIVRLVPKEEAGEALNELAKLYEEDRVLVYKTLSTIAMDRIRGMAARTFAEAFRLGKKDDDDG